LGRKPFSDLGGGERKRSCRGTRTERVFDPPANLVEVDADAPKGLGILLIERHGVTLANDPHDLRADIVEMDPEPVERLVPALLRSRRSPSRRCSVSM
jgi:hypothetical protein